MELPRHDIDPDGPLEYSVVFTDRSVNHAARPFIVAFQELLQILRDTYADATVAVVPGGGSYAMEAVARQLVDERGALVIRNGLFSYRWSQIFAAIGAPEATLCKARPASADPRAEWTPPPVDEVCATIREVRPPLVFAPHVETAAGLILPDDYLRQVAAATHAAGGLFVLDCVASGAIWVNMRELGIDVLISAPQKGWSGTPCAGYVMLSDAARARVRATISSSFTMDLKKWLEIAEGYVDGKPAYHATMPTDGLIRNADAMRATVALGLDEAQRRQVELGAQVRTLLASKGFPSIAAEAFQAPGVIVAYCDTPEQKSGAAFAQAGVRVAAGVPLHCGEPAGFQTFRIGLFGLDKLADVDATVQRLADALQRL